MQLSTLPAPPADIVTPKSAGSVITGQALPELAARVGAWIAALWGRPFRIGSRVIVARHSQVLEVLSRDLDFRIAPVNEARIDAVNGPFVLGMDRGATLIAERAALYQALSQVDMAPIRAAAAAEATARIEAAGADIDVVLYARPIAAQTASRIFGVAGPDPATFMEVARAIFAHTFLNIGGDHDIEARALTAAEMMRAWLQTEIARRRASGDLGHDMMGALLRGSALDDDGVRRTLDDDGVRRTLGGMLVGSIDTTTSSVAKIIAVIAKDRALADRVAADVDNPDRLADWCREALRRWPHNPILLRKAQVATVLGGTDIQAGDDIFAWTQAAMNDPDVFPNPSVLRPGRPVAAYLHFGAGLHPCAGRVVNAWQIPLLVGALIRRGIASAGAVQWAGPFPDRLPLRFR